MWFAVDYDDNVYVVYEHFAAGKDIDYHAAAIGAACASLGWHTDPKGRICALIDSAAKQHTLSGVKSVCELFYERDILVNADVDKDLFSGIARVKSYLNEKNGLPSLYIFSSCVNLIRRAEKLFLGERGRAEKNGRSRAGRPEILPDVEAEKAAARRRKDGHTKGQGTEVAADRGGKKRKRRILWRLKRERKKWERRF